MTARMVYGLRAINCIAATTSEPTWSTVRPGHRQVLYRITQRVLDLADQAA
jgi:hypothetical protein